MGFAEKVPREEVSDKTRRVWYIPHHGVYFKKKPGKIRVLFDCSALQRLLPQSAASTRSIPHQQSHWGVVSVTNGTNSLHVRHQSDVPSSKGGQQSSRLPPIPVVGR